MNTLPSFKVLRPFCASEMDTAGPALLMGMTDSLGCVELFVFEFYTLSAKWKRVGAIILGGACRLSVREEKNETSQTTGLFISIGSVTYQLAGIYISTGLAAAGQ